METNGRASSTVNNDIHFHRFCYGWMPKRASSMTFMLLKLLVRWRCTKWPSLLYRS